MKKRIILTINLILAIFLAVFTVGYTFAWFADYYTVDIKLYVETDGGYFASGDGSESSPYIISKPRHLYNLAWLQNTGRISNNTYFEISTNLDMSGYIIPPIGNDAHPFNSIINGNGCTISGLKVTTDKQTLSASFVNERSESYTFSKYVGLFGNTGTSSNIYNFILNDPVVEVASDNTSYSSSGSSACCGLAIGYVAGSASSIGVIGGTLAVRKEGYTTYNSILGSISSSTATSITGGADIGYGTSTDIEELYTTLKNNTETIDDNTPVIKKYYAFPFRASNQTFVDSADVASGGEAETTTVKLSSDSKSVSVARTQAAASNNIGYYVGSDIKAYYEKVTDTTIYDTFYYPNNSTESYVCGKNKIAKFSDGSVAYTYTDNSITVYPAPSDDIVAYLKTYGNYFIRLTGSSLDYTNESGLLYIDSEYAQVSGYTGGILVPRRCIWVAPVQAGTIKIVAVNIGSKDMGIRVYKLTRSTAKDYSSYFSSGTYDISSGGLEYNATLLIGAAYYFEIAVTEADIDAGYEYAISGEHDTYIAYIDLGQTGGTGSVTTTNEVTNIDFIYKDVTVSTTGFEIDGGTFVETGTRIYFGSSQTTSNTAVLILAFTRTDSTGITTVDGDETEYTIKVTYYTAGTDSPGQSGYTAKAYIVADSTDTLKDFDITTYSTDSS